jgi:ADP-heptose:LPS heptosyltransferase
MLQSAGAGRAWRLAHPLTAGAGQRIVVLNIGCGTEDAIPKRPALPDLVAGLVALYGRQAFALHLSGADFEREVNEAFLTLFKAAMARQGWQTEAMDWSGQLSLDELTGLLGQADLVVSSDSGPYHMAVVLGRCPPRAGSTLTHRHRTTCSPGWPRRPGLSRSNWQRPR